MAVALAVLMPAESRQTRGRSRGPAGRGGPGRNASGSAPRPTRGTAAWQRDASASSRRGGPTRAAPTASRRRPTATRSPAQPVGRHELQVLDPATGLQLPCDIPRCSSHNALQERGGVARLDVSRATDTLPLRAGLRLGQFGQAALRRPGPGQPVELPEPPQLGGVGPDHVVAVGVATRRQPAGPQPAPHRVPRDPQPPRQARRAVLVAAQAREAAVRLAAGQAQVPQAAAAPSPG